MRLMMKRTASEMGDKTEYELMYIIKQEVSHCYPNGIDSESATVDDALGVIRYLLKNDYSVNGYKLIKKTVRKRRR